MLLKEIDGSLPGQFRSGLIVPRGGVIVETMVDIGIDIGGILLLILFQGSLVCGPAIVNAGVETCIVQEKRRLYLRDIFLWRLGAIERDRGGQIGQLDGHLIGDGAAKAETYDPDLTVTVGLLSEVLEGVDKILEHFILVPFGQQVAAFIIIAGVAAQWR